MTAAMYSYLLGGRNWYGGFPEQTLLRTVAIDDDRGGLPGICLVTNYLIS